MDRDIEKIFQDACRDFAEKTGNNFSDLKLIIDRKKDPYEGDIDVKKREMTVGWGDSLKYINTEAMRGLFLHELGHAHLHYKEDGHSELDSIATELTNNDANAKQLAAIKIVIWTMIDARVTHYAKQMGWTKETREWIMERLKYFDAPTENQRRLGLPVIAFSTKIALLILGETFDPYPTIAAYAASVEEQNVVERCCQFAHLFPLADFEAGTGEELKSWLIIFATSWVGILSPSQAD